MSDENENITVSTGGTADGAGAEKPNPGEQAVQFTPAQQAHINAIIAERLKRDREKWEADAQSARERAEREAEAQRLAEQQKWQELAQKRETEVKDLQRALEEGQKREGRLTRLEAALKAQLEAQRQGLAPHLLTLLDKMPVEEQLEYLSANAAALRPAGQVAGIPPTPPGQGAPGLTEDERRQLAAGIRSYW
jgi:DNA repair exonuclease SbcCD ATPase subunit